MLLNSLFSSVIVGAFKSYFMFMAEYIFNSPEFCSCFSAKESSTPYSISIL